MSGQLIPRAVREELRVFCRFLLSVVAGDVGLLAAPLDDQTAAAVYVRHILVRNDREVTRNQFFAGFRGPAFL